MSDFGLEVEPRGARGKGAARKLRAIGRIPGVCYRPGVESAPISLDSRALDLQLRASSAGMNTLFNLKVHGGGNFDGSQVLVKELQRDPVSGAPLHADLFAVDLTQRIHVSVPVHVVGTSFGVTMGGILDHTLRELEVECLPTAIPEELTVDATPLDVGDSIHARDVALPPDVVLLTDANLPVVSVVAPAVAEEETPEEAELEEGAEAPAEGAEAAAAASEGSEEKSGD